MTSKERAEILLQYLHILQVGRTKPNNSGVGSVQESKDNIPEMNAVKEELNKELGIKLHNQTIEFK